jgi:hypothetical protein
VSPLCLVVAGVVRATIPDAEITLSWDHSVEHTRWEEHYRLSGDALVLTRARVRGTGAGMEPPPGSVLRDGWWTWEPQTRFAALRLTHSSYTRDYTLCWRSSCRTLGALVGATPEGEAIEVRACPPPRTNPSASTR